MLVARVGIDPPSGGGDNPRSIARRLASCAGWTVVCLRNLRTPSTRLHGDHQGDLENYGGRTTVLSQGHVAGSGRKLLCDPTGSFPHGAEGAQTHCAQDRTGARSAASLQRRAGRDGRNPQRCGAPLWLQNEAAGPSGVGTAHSPRVAALSSGTRYPSSPAGGEARPRIATKRSLRSNPVQVSLPRTFSSEDRQQGTSAQERAEGYLRHEQRLLVGVVICTRTPAPQ